MVDNADPGMEHEEYEITRNNLIGVHGFYKPLIERNFWYAGDPWSDGIYGEKIRFGASGPPEGTDLLQWSIRQSDEINTHGYWMPHPELRHHIVRQANKPENQEKLNVLRSDQQKNPNFAHFHSAFDPELQRYEINDAVRLCAIDDRTITVAKATYLDQLGTNITADTKIANSVGGLDSSHTGMLAGKTCRALDTLPDGKLKPLSECLQANTIGITTVALDKNNRIIARFRNFNSSRLVGDDVNRRLGAMNKGWHCFSSGVLEWSDVKEGVNQNSMAAFCDGLTEGMRREIWLETGFERNSSQYTIVPFGFARELKRPGKPQLFFLVKFHSLDAEEVCRRIEDNYRFGVVLEAEEYGAPTDQSLINLRKAINRMRGKHLPGFWIIDDIRFGQLQKSALKAISEKGWENETVTYEFYGALCILSNLDLNTFLKR